MKLYVKSDTSYDVWTLVIDFKYLGIDTNSVPKQDTIAASKDLYREINIEYRSNVKQEQQLTTKELDEYESIINEVYNILTYEYGFVIFNNYQSTTYSYYIDFMPTDLNGNRLPERFEIQFRISNHVGSGNFGQINEHYGRKQFILNTHKYSQYDVFVAKIREICGQLCIGDKSSIRDTTLDNF